MRPIPMAGVAGCVPMDRHSSPITTERRPHGVALQAHLTALHVPPVSITLSDPTAGTVTYDVTVAGAEVGSPQLYPSGTVTVTDGTSSCANLVLTSSGTARCTLNETPGTSYTVTATYSGDTNYGPNTGQITASSGTTTAGTSN